MRRNVLSMVVLVSVSVMLGLACSAASDPEPSEDTHAKTGGVAAEECQVEADAEGDGEATSCAVCNGADGWETFSDDESDWETTGDEWVGADDLESVIFNAAEDGAGGMGEDANPADGGAAQCTIDVVNGIVTKCCQDPYSGTKNCTDFANQFHNLCTVSGLSCKTVSISCKGGKEGHRTNMIYIEGKGWCGIEPQSGKIYEPCVADPNNIPADLLCKMALAEPGCDCTVNCVSDKPLPSNTKPWQCKQKGGSYGACTGCCGDHWWYKYCKKNKINGCDKWLSACLNECKGLPIK